MKAILAALVSFHFLLHAASAAPLSVVNPGFEADFVPDGTFNDNITPAGWSIYDPDGIIGSDFNVRGLLNPTGTALYVSGAPEGRNVALVFLWPQNPNQDNLPAGLAQTLSATLQANTRYTLTVQVGNIAAIGNPPYDLNGFPGYSVQLLANGVLLAQDLDTLGIPEGTFALSTVQFTTGASHPQIGQALIVRLINLNRPDSGIEVNFDDVRVDATVLTTPTVSPTISSTATRTPSATSTLTQLPGATATATRTPSATSTLTQLPGATATATRTPSATSTLTQLPGATATATRTPSATPTDTATGTSTPTDTATRTPSPTDTPGTLQTPSQTASRTNTPANGVTRTETRTPTSVPTTTSTAPETSTATGTAPPAGTGTATPTSSLQPLGGPASTGARILTGFVVLLLCLLRKSGLWNRVHPASGEPRSAG